MSPRHRAAEIRVLLVHAEQEGQLALRELLGEIDDGRTYRLDWLADWDAALATIAGGTHDVAFVDEVLGTRDGLDLVHDAVASGARVPMIVLAREGGAVTQRRVSAAGAVDWLVQDELDPFAIARSIRYCVGTRGIGDETRLRMAVADRIVSSSRLAGDIADAIDHPLASLIGDLDLLRVEVAQRPALAPILADAFESAHRVFRIVRDLEVFSRADEHRRVPVDVRRVVESAVRLASAETRWRARVVQQHGEAPRVEANQARLGLVIFNVLVNAAHAIPHGTPEQYEIRIVTGTNAAGDAVLEVHDNGAGIPADELPRIFDPFTTNKPSSVGTGLSLAISQRIVHEMGGEIRVSSEFGRGTSVHVRLPPAW